MNVIITGAGRGIGLELTRQLLNSGHRVHVVMRNLDKNRQIENLKREFGDKLTAVQTALGDENSVAKVVESAESLGNVDLLINNAGIMIEDDSFENFANTFLINSTVPYFLTKAMSSLLKKSRSPKAIHVSSLMGSIADNSSGGYYSYRASKAALNMINKSLSRDYNWLTSIVVHPGWVQTDMGGSQAPVKVADSAEGILKVISQVNLEQSGGFFDYKGNKLPW